jgi:hypothetical protein
VLILKFCTTPFWKLLQSSSMQRAADSTALAFTMAADGFDIRAGQALQKEWTRWSLTGRRFSTALA